MFCCWCSAFTLQKCRQEVGCSFSLEFLLSFMLFQILASAPSICPGTVSVLVFANGEENIYKQDVHLVQSHYATRFASPWQLYVGKRGSYVRLALADKACLEGFWWDWTWECCRVVFFFFLIAFVLSWHMTYGCSSKGSKMSKGSSSGGA